MVFTFHLSHFTTICQWIKEGVITQSAHILRTDNNSENNSEKEKNNNIIIIKKDAEKHPIGFDLDEFFNAACIK